MQDSRKGNALVIGVIVVVILVAAVFFVWKWMGGGMGNAVPQGSPAFAPAGTVVQGFPQDLLIDTPSAVQSSYAINYSTSTNQYTAQWASTKSVDATFSDYQTYLATSNWFITNQTSQNGIDNIFAKNGAESANISIFTQNSSTQVLVSYLKQ